MNKDLSNVRLGKRQTDKTRKSIQVSVICDRLEKCATGQLQMSAQELKASEILLRKTLPDLSSVDSNVTVDDKRDLSEIQADASKLLAAAGLDKEVIAGVLNQVKH